MFLEAEINVEIKIKNIYPQMTQIAQINKKIKKNKIKTKGHIAQRAQKTQQKSQVRER